MRKFFEFLLTLLGFIKKPKTTPTPSPSPVPSSTPKPSVSKKPKPSPTPMPSSTPDPTPAPSPIPIPECGSIPVLNKITLISGSLFEYNFTCGSECTGVYLQYSRDPEGKDWVTDQNMVECTSPQTLDIEITQGTIYFAIVEDCEFNLSPSNVLSYTFPK
jgi:hypothetical protein